MSLHTGLIKRAVPCGLGPLEDGFLETWEVFDPDPFRCRFLDVRCELCLDCFDPIEFRLPSETDSASPKHFILTSTFPPSGVNFREFETKLMITCSIRCWSPHRHMSFNLPIPWGPRAGRAFLLTFSDSMFVSVPMNFTPKLIWPSRTCLSNIVLDKLADVSYYSFLGLLR